MCGRHCPTDNLSILRIDALLLPLRVPPIGTKQVGVDDAQGLITMGQGKDLDAFAQDLVRKGKGVTFWCLVCERHEVVLPHTRKRILANRDE